MIVHSCLGCTSDLHLSRLDVIQNTDKIDKGERGGGGEVHVDKVIIIKSPSTLFANHNNARLKFILSESYLTNKH